MDDLFKAVILRKIDDVCASIKSMELSKQIEIINEVRRRLHQVSPFYGEPIDFVEWVPIEAVKANDYNPNTVAPPEMRLLRRSIEQDGYTQPVVAFPVSEAEKEVVDGFHRTRCAKEFAEIKNRVHGHLPLTYIKADREDIQSRMAATIRHNRARGKHGILPMTDIVADLIKAGLTDDEVAKEIGMDADEVLRFKQNKGLPELFKNNEYSKAWK